MDDTEQQAPAPQESPAPRREPLLNLPGIVLLFMALCAALHALRVYVLSEDQAINQIVYGAFIPLRYTGAYPLDLAAFTSPLRRDESTSATTTTLPRARSARCSPVSSHPCACACAIARLAASAGSHADGEILNECARATSEVLARPWG